MGAEHSRARGSARHSLARNGKGLSTPVSGSSPTEHPQQQVPLTATTTGPSEPPATSAMPGSTLAPLQGPELPPATALTTTESPRPWVVLEQHSRAGVPRDHHSARTQRAVHSTDPIDSVGHDVEGCARSAPIGILARSSNEAAAPRTLTMGTAHVHSTNSAHTHVHVHAAADQDWVDLSDDDDIIPASGVGRRHHIEREPHANHSATSAGDLARYSSRYIPTSSTGISDDSQSSASTAPLGPLHTDASFSAGSPSDTGFLSETSMTDIIASATAQRTCASSPLTLRTPPPPVRNNDDPREQDTMSPASSGGVTVTASASARTSAASLGGDFDSLRSAARGLTSHQYAMQYSSRHRPVARRTGGAVTPVGLRELAADHHHSRGRSGIHGTLLRPQLPNDERWEMVVDEADDLETHYRQYLDRMKAAEELERTDPERPSLDLPTTRPQPQQQQRQPQQQDPEPQLEQMPFPQRVMSGMWAGFHPPSSPYEKQYWSD